MIFDHKQRKKIGKYQMYKINSTRTLERCWISYSKFVQQELFLWHFVEQETFFFRLAHCFVRQLPLHEHVALLTPLRIKYLGAMMKGIYLLIHLFPGLTYVSGTANNCTTKSTDYHWLRHNPRLNRAFSQGNVIQNFLRHFLWTQIKEHVKLSMNPDF